MINLRNGHLLTHRNKKPFECDQLGCGKSYCDARSLRRHIENHHKCGVNLGSTKAIFASSNTIGNQFDNVHVKNIEIRPRTWNIQVRIWVPPFDIAKTQTFFLENPCS